MQIFVVESWDSEETRSNRLGFINYSLKVTATFEKVIENPTLTIYV